MCSIRGDPTDGPDTGYACDGLLRWVRGYFALDLSLPARIVPETRFVEDLGVESLDWMSWRFEAEERLGIVFPDEQLERIQTVGQFICTLREAGAVWPAHSDVRLPTRRNCWSPYCWAIVPTGESQSQNGSRTDPRS